MELIELIVFPIAFIYFLWLHYRDKRIRRLQPAWQIIADAVIDRDEAGNIRTIFIKLP